MTGVAIIPPVLATVMYFVLPDSPDWLIRQGHIKEAREAFLWLRGNDIVQVSIVSLALLIVSIVEVF